ncbi:PEPxxWA-CTERM sorting domain-containing protein [Phenylobacterium sp.]
MVPEPATWAIMLTGFFGLGAVLRRQRSALA